MIKIHSIGSISKKVNINFFPSGGEIQIYKYRTSDTKNHYYNITSSDISVFGLNMTEFLKMTDPQFIQYLLSKKFINPEEYLQLLLLL